MSRIRPIGLWLVAALTRAAAPAAALATTRSLSRRIALGCILVFAAQAPIASAQTALVEKAAGHPATASSVEQAGFEATKANDSSTTTRWSSTRADNQWWQVDLGSARAVSQVQVQWEAA